jgi:TonB-dependent SusC/RagA subfamily outer membrane receptor
MNFKNFLLIILVCIGSFSVLFAQEPVSLTIKVVDPYTNTPIEGAVVSALDNCTDSVCSRKTNNQGEVTLSLRILMGDVAVWSPGYYQNTVSILGRTLITVVLIPENKLGYNNENEKQTNLYSVQKKNIKLTKSFVDETFDNVPGLQVIEKSGMPGEGVYFNFRGISSVVGNTSPLIVINGVPYFPDQNESPIIGGYSKNILNSLSASDIENITFLKGADAAIYGSLGSNGVILVETDKATDLETKINKKCRY